MDAFLRREVYPRLLVLGLIALVCTGFGFAMRGSVHIGRYPMYDPPAATPREAPADVHLMGRQSGEDWAIGWAYSHMDRDCATLVVLVSSSNHVGHLYTGPLPSRGWMYFSGRFRDGNDDPLPLADRLVFSAQCYELSPPRRTPIRVD